MPHWSRGVGLVVRKSCDDCDGSARYQLPNEGDGSARLTGYLSSHIEAKIHFLECAMPRDGHAEQSCVGEEKSNETQVRLAMPGIELGANRHVRTEQRWLNDVVEHQQIAPFGRQEPPRQRVRAQM
jgi:hypothetical protein